MSGHKRATVSINQEEYDRLREAEIRMRSLPDFSPSTQQAISQQSSEALERSLTTAQNRIDQYERIISGMSDQIVALESVFTQQLYDVQVNMTVETQRYAGTLRDHFDRLKAESDRHYQEMIEANHQILENQMAALAEQQQALASSITARQEAAAQWINDTNHLFAFLRDSYDCDQFAPGQLARLDIRFQQAVQNYQSGMFEASLSICQQVYIELSDLHIELERAESEWQMLHLCALETLNQIIERAIDSQEVEAIDLEGNPLSFTIYVDEWVEGRLKKWIDALADFRDQIQDQKIFLDTETLRRLLDDDFRAYVQDLEEIVLDARIKALNSQLRINIADLVIQALQDQGFALKNAGYKADDLRETYRVRLYNREGSEVLVNVAPGENGFGENEVFIQSQDSDSRTEHELIQRWKEVTRSLRYYGLEVGPYEEVPERSGRLGSFPRRLKNAARRLTAGVSNGRSEEVNEYRTDP